MAALRIQTDRCVVVETAIPVDGDLENFNGTLFIDNFLNYAIRQSQGKLMLSDGKQHLMDDIIFDISMGIQ